MATINSIGTGKITASTTGVVSPTSGGTGVTNPAPHTLPIANGTSPWTFAGPMNDGALLIGNTGGAPTPGIINGSQDILITNVGGGIGIGNGVIPTARGGTGLIHPASNTFMLGGASGPMTAAGPLTDGQVWVGTTGGAPVHTHLGAGDGIAISTGPGSILINATGPLVANSLFTVYTYTGAPRTFTFNGATVAATIELWASGGGGGGAYPQALGATATGGGGGGGGYVKLYYDAAAINSTPSGQLIFFIAAAGVGGIDTGGLGGNGGNTAYGNIDAENIMTVLGGSGGNGNTTLGSPFTSFPLGGIGGLYNTGPGANWTYFTAIHGGNGGNGSLNTTNNVQTETVYISGNGGASGFGTTTPPISINSFQSSPFAVNGFFNGAPAASFGGGGVGGMAGWNGSARYQAVGGVGGDGLVVITEYLGST